MKKLNSRWTVGGILVLLLLSLFSSVVVNGASEKIKVNFWTLNARGELAKKVIADFNASNPNIEIVLTLNSTDDQKKNLKIAAASQSLPDMWFNWGGSLASFYSENGLSLDLNSYAKKNKWNEHYIQTALDMCRFHGQLSGLPTGITGLGIYYNKQMFQKYNIKVPKTFAEFEAAMKTLKENGITPISTAGKDGWLVMRLNEAILEHFAGSALHDKLDRLSTSWNNPKVIQMYTKLKEWNDKGYFPQGFLTLDPNGDKLLLYADQAAMVMQVSSFDNNVNLDKQDGKKFGWFPFPTDMKPNRISAFVEMIQFSKKSPEAVQKAALKFAEFFYSNSEISKYPSDYKYPLVINGVKTPDTLPNIPAVVDSLSKNGSWLISDQALPQEVISKFFYTQDSVAIGIMTPKLAAQYMDDEIKKYKATIK